MIMNLGVPDQDLFLIGTNKGKARSRAFCGTL